MDLDDVRSILDNSGADIWNLIETAIAVATVDYGTELRDRRDGIISKLYAEVLPACRNCDVNHQGIANGGGRMNGTSIRGRDRRGSLDLEETKGESTVNSPTALDDEYGQEEDRAVEDEKLRILAIRDELDSHQSEESLVELLQSLADMEITFGALKETDIGRHVNRLRKHSSSEVRRLVKLLVRKWKDLVDAFVSLDTAGELQASALLADGDSPQQNTIRNQQNGHNQVPDFGYSPNPHNGNSSVEKSNLDLEIKRKTAPSRRDPPTNRTVQNASFSTPPAPQSRQREAVIDPERLASARRRLQENYQEAQNAKKQRTVQVMDIHELPKPKNGFFARNRGGFHGRH